MRIEPLIPPAKHGGRKRSVKMREVINGLFYVLETGCSWGHLPKDLPLKRTVHDYFDLWSLDGTLERMHDALYVELREAEGREPQPSVAILDSQSAKSAQKGGRGSMRWVSMPERRSRARSGRFSPTDSA